MNTPASARWRMARRTPPRASRAPSPSPIAARQHFDQFADLAPLLGLVTGCDRVLDAVRNVVGEDFLLGAAQRRARRRELGDDVDAIAVVLDHAGEPAHLALDPLEPLHHRRLGIRPHVRYIPLQGIRFKQASWKLWFRRIASAAAPSTR